MMQDSNPYSPAKSQSSPPPHMRERSAAKSLLPLVVGLSCALAGPLFLSSFWHYHGHGLGLKDSVLFFGVAYLPTALCGIVLSVPLGYALRLVCPQVGMLLRWAITGGVATIIFATGIGMLTGGYLNFGVDLIMAWPAFSVYCAAATMVTTAAYIALS